MGICRGTYEYGTKVAHGYQILIGRRNKRNIIIFGISGQGRQEEPDSPGPRHGHQGGSENRDRRGFARLADAVQARQDRVEVHRSGLPPVPDSRIELHVLCRRRQAVASMSLFNAVSSSFG